MQYRISAQKQDASDPAVTYFYFVNTTDVQGSIKLRITTSKPCEEKIHIYVRSIHTILDCTVHSTHTVLIEYSC